MLSSGTLFPVTLITLVFLPGLLILHYTNIHLLSLLRLSGRVLAIASKIMLTAYSYRPSAVVGLRLSVRLLVRRDHEPCEKS